MSKNKHFIHDCDDCEHLGSFYDEEESIDYDLYCHINNNQIKTVIGRYSSLPSGYVSGLSFSYGIIKSLTEARIRAEKLGYEVDPLWGKRN